VSQQQRQVGAVPSRVDQGRVAQLVQRPPGARLEQFAGSPVRQPRPAGRVQVEVSDRAGWPAVT
jgi:hypothetical protein